MTKFKFICTHPKESYNTKKKDKKTKKKLEFVFGYWLEEHQNKKKREELVVA